MAIPNLTHIVALARQQHPQAWKDAHTGNAHTEDFIRLVTPMLAAVDVRIGLNGKRGNASDISDDAVNVRGEGPGHNNDGTPCTVVDIIGGAGGPNPVPQWGVQDDPVASTGAWVSPGSAPTPLPIPPPPPPVVKPYPGDAYFTDQIGVVLENDYREAGQSLNAGSATWFARTIWRHVNEGMPMDQSVAQSRKEWRAALGLPPPAIHR